MSISWLSVLLLSILPADNSVEQEFLSEGVTARVGGYRPIRIQLSEEGENVKTPPADLSAPKFGSMELNGKTYGVILDEPEGEDAVAKFYVDANADGDYTNDPEINWIPPATATSTYRGDSFLSLSDSQQGKVFFYRFNPKTPGREAYANIVLYYTDFGYEYTFNIDDETYKASVSGSPSEGMALWFDRNKDGRRSSNYEMARVGAPFNFTGNTYVLNLSGDAISIDKADTELPQMPLPPDLRLGKQSLSFTATRLDGEKVEFPGDYAGKIVMLDFWATWCGPCIGEIPNMKEAYEAHHENGFEILGVSFDSEGMEEKLQTFLKERELPWPQIYEGKGWNTTLGKQHDVSGIPFVLLVDGDSGEIIGTSRELRGEGLSDYIAKQLAAKKSE